MKENCQLLRKIYGDDNLIVEGEEISQQIYDILFNDLTKLEFQDILSQRLLKISNFLKDVEKEVLKILLLFGLNDSSTSDEKKREIREKLKEIEWKKEISQEDVDDILKEFGL